MRKYRLKSDSPADENVGEESKTGGYTFRDYEGEKIRYPEFLFKSPEAEKIIDVISDDIEGKWKGLMMTRVAAYRDNKVAPYNPDIDYPKEYKKINHDIFEVSGDLAEFTTPLMYRKFEWFNNNRITAHEELVQYVFNIDIIRVSDGIYSLKLKCLFKKYTMECFFSKHGRRHKLLDYILGINYNEERRKLITDHLEGTEATIYDSNDLGNYLEKKGEFYTLDHNAPEPEEILGDAGANCTLTYDESRYRFVLQQIANNQLVLHGSWFDDCTMNWNDLVKEKSQSGTRQFRTVLRRERVEPKTQITVGGDYVEKKVEIKDSVVSRSEI